MKARIPLIAFLVVTAAVHAVRSRSSSCVDRCATSGSIIGGCGQTAAETNTR